ncbi:MAG: hypothetical protein HS105_01975 [Chloracidobacterium sp.]|nr:hypothetical protein [Chloracidobacterium sp.]MCO5334471.1 hypothetical protein [Pyrinomonadaceae bacterium]
MRNWTGVLAVVVLFTAAFACSMDETSKANDLVKEANTFITAGNDIATKAEDLGGKLDGKLDNVKDKSDLEDARSMAKDLGKMYDDLGDNFKKAGDKFTEASKLKINDKFKEYLETKAKEFSTRHDYSVELKKIPQKLIDSDSETEYRSLYKDQMEKVQSMLKDAKDLSDKADKIVKDNPDVMKGS